MIALTRRSFLGATFCAAALPLRLRAASAFPDGRPIRLIVPYTPGGGTDSVARAIAAKITGSVGWSVVVENRPGAGGNIGMDYVAKTKPDGFMLGLGQTANLAINPALMPKMPFDASKDFSAVAMIASLPVVLVVKANARWQTLADLVKEARANPGAIKQALAGSGTVGHLAGELLAYQAKFEVLNVPYRGAAPALNDLLGENTDYMFATPQAAQEMLKGNVLRPLAVTARERLSILPDVPTVAESGFDGFEALDWKALVAPRRHAARGYCRGQQRGAEGADGPGHHRHVHGGRQQGHGRIGAVGAAVHPGRAEEVGASDPRGEHPDGGLISSD
ncbi:Tat pathway signal sequence domain protein [Achromobacter piechaudii ATCC 43553]|uniref:Tat pathway signal sequence domain protein n=1 Tax=Achromobacter piechaudii ATCC 43553 TaxID=742159 RepID=D4XCK2_9BURK|nr:Tat pathway signal sequence domain protein [Achromobacter piechaudii ATCC 43553]